MFIIATGDHPPPTLNDKDKWSANFHDFIAQCLIKDPKDRPTAATLLNHPFIKGAATDRSELAGLAVSVINVREQKRIEKEMKVCLFIIFRRISFLIIFF